MRKRIIIGFKYELDQLDYLPECDREYIKSTHMFYVDSMTSTVRDILKEVLKNITQDEDKSYDDDYLWTRFWGVINGSICELNFDFSAAEYYTLNEINGVAYLYYAVSPRGGAGFSIGNSITMCLWSKECGHAFLPHIHVRKGSYNRADPHSNMIGVSLEDLSIIEGTENQARRLFRRDWDRIMLIIAENREHLLDNYEAMRKGGLPERIEYDPKEGSLVFISQQYKYPGIS